MTRLNAWIAWPAAPLTRLSIDADRDDPTGRSSSRTWTRAKLLPWTCVVAGALATTSTNGSSA